MAWRRPGDKPLSEPRMESLPTHICVTRPQWVKSPTAMVSRRVPVLCHENWIWLYVLCLIIIWFYIYIIPKISSCTGLSYDCHSANEACLHSIYTSAMETREILTHRNPVVSYSVINFRSILLQLKAWYWAILRQNMKLCCCTVNATSGDKLQWKLDEYRNFFHQENASE